jgi:hypothetical protein
LGDAAWETPTNLTPSDQDFYLNDRTGRGFNAVLIEAIEHKFTANKPPLDFASNLPFSKRLDGATYSGSPNGTTTPAGNAGQYGADPYSDIHAQAPDFTYPTLAHWTQMDTFISLCASKGVAVFLFPAYVGYAGADEGWMAEMVENDAVLGTGGFGAQPWSDATKSKLWNYGAWVAQHYASFTNIVWVMGGDFGTGIGGPLSTAQAKAIANLVAGMKSVANQKSHLWTAHWGRGSLGTDLAQFAPSIDLQSVYANASAASQARSGYASAPTKPTFEIEDYYEGNPKSGEPNRVFQWGSFLGAIAGQFYGNEAVWPYASSWKSAMDSQGAKDMAILNGFIRSLAWQNLVPSGLAGTKTIVVANGGSGDTDTIACAADAGATAVCYVPPGWSAGSFTVDSTVMGAPYRARWFDPTNGAFTSIASGLANTGTHAFSPPGKNGAGATDWALVLDLAGNASGKAPTIAQPAAASLAMDGKTASLSVLGADDGGEAALTYTWATIGAAPAPVAFSVNGTNAAKSAIATFSKAGSYTLQATITDADANSVTSSVAVTIAGADSIEMGAATILPLDDSGNAGWLSAQQTSLAEAATLESLSFYVATPAGQLRLGLYDASGSGGGPGNKLAETGELTVTSSGWLSADVLSGVLLQPGTYWLVFFGSDDGLHSRKAPPGGGASRYYKTSYGALPAVFDDALATSDTVEWSLYATLTP